MQPKKKESVMKYKLAYTGLILFVYILGKSIPLYGLELSAYSEEAARTEDVLMQAIGGDAYRSSVFALGIFPYMISGILVQLAMACRSLVSKTRISPGKLSRVSAAVTFAIAVLQAALRVPELVFAVTDDMLYAARAVAVLEMVTGVMVIMWLAGRNARYGIGGRMVFGLVNMLERIISVLTGHDMESLVLPLAVSAVLLLVMLLMENTEKRIPVQRISIHNIYGDQNYMAVKLNPVGVMPVMFSSALFMLPVLTVSLLGRLFPGDPGIGWWEENLSLLKPFGIFIYVVCEYVLTVVFSMIMISPKNVTEQFLKSGDSIVDLHAGRDTRRYLRGVMWRISLFGATVMGACIAVPRILQLKGEAGGAMTMLPTSVMMFTGLWCNVYREAVAVRRYDACRPLF